MSENRFKGAIFDMDGLLVNSEPFWMAAEKEIFSEVGLTLSDSMCLQTRGLRIQEVVEYWYQRFPLFGNVDNTRSRLEESVAAHIATDGQALPGVHQTLEQLLKAGFLIGLASSSPLPIIQSVIQKLKITDYFKVTLSANDLLYGKPHPLVYLESAQKLGLPPHSCIAFEDSITGLIAAKAASMFVIAVPESAHTSDPRFQIADRVLPTLEGFCLDLLNP